MISRVKRLCQSLLRSFYHGNCHTYVTRGQGHRGSVPLPVRIIKASAHPVKRCASSLFSYAEGRPRPSVGRKRQSSHTRSYSLSFFSPQRGSNTDRVMRGQAEQRREVPGGIDAGHGDEAGLAAVRRARQSVPGIRRTPRVFQGVEPADFGKLQIGGRCKRAAFNQPPVQNPRIEQAFVRLCLKAGMPEHHGQRADQTAGVTKERKIRLREQLARPGLRPVEAGVRLPPVQICVFQLPSPLFIRAAGLRRPGPDPATGYSGPAPCHSSRQRKAP